MLALVVELSVIIHMLRAVCKYSLVERDKYRVAWMFDFEIGCFQVPVLRRVFRDRVYAKRLNESRFETVLDAP